MIDTEMIRALAQKHGLDQPDTALIAFAQAVAKQAQAEMLRYQDIMQNLGWEKYP
jgi:hypothetical protein